MTITIFFFFLHNGHHSFPGQKRVPAGETNNSFISYIKAIYAFVGRGNQELGLHETITSNVCDLRSPTTVPLPARKIALRDKKATRSPRVQLPGTTGNTRSSRRLQALSPNSLPLGSFSRGTQAKPTNRHPDSSHATPFTPPPTDTPSHTHTHTHTHVTPALYCTSPIT